MAAEDKKDLTGMTEAELNSELQGLEQELQQMRFTHAARGIANPMEIRGVRREIARVHTEARKRELSTMSQDQLDLRSKIRARRRRQK